MQSALAPLPDNGATSWTQRPALGEAGNLGQLYDARKDQVLGSFILKTISQLLPEKSVQPTIWDNYTYEATVSDSLEEKFSKLQVSVDFRASLLCGMLTGGWGVDYCSSHKTHARTVQASIICKTKKKSEDLLLNDELREYLDLKALHTAGATHVICGLDWGAQTIVTAEMVTETVDQARSIQAGIGNRGAEVKDRTEEDERVAKQGILGRVLDTIGKAHAGGETDWDNTFKRKASSFKFKVISDVGDPGIPKDVDDVLRFLETSKSNINSLAGGKGVPIAFRLRPIDDVAKVFDITLQHDTTVQRLDDEYIAGFVKLLEKRRATRLELEEYEAFLQQHSFCVPVSQIEKVSEQLEDVRYEEVRLRNSLKEAVQSIRSGREKMDKLRVALGRCKKKAEIPSEYPSILREYVDKIHFANTIKDQGAKYIRNSAAERDTAITSSDTSEIYILYFDEASRQHPDWNENRRKLMELLYDKDGSHAVIVVDCDLGNSGQLEKPYIEQCRDGKVIVADVIQDRRELDEMCCVKCSDKSKVDHSRSAKPPPASRVMRVPCPIKRCHTSGKYRWTCPDCRQQVFYGFTDEYLYCQCARYPYSLAVFKCRNHDAHGKDYVKHNDADLLKLLQALNSQEQYNILILGETGVGKSMFLNAFYNYLIYDSLEGAMADPRELQYLIPCAFSMKEKIDGKEVERAVVVGEATKFETLSRDLESGTTKPIVYTFLIEDKVIMFIDTPGVGDTRGVTQDEKNLRGILRTLERAGVDKLSAVLILLKPNLTRLTPAFEFCLTELLRHLHLDIVHNNTVFGFTNASGTRYNSGTTGGLLKKVFSKLKIEIALGDRNQFFFDSEGFMFLADYKQNGLQVQDRPSFEKMWTHSADEAHRFLSTIMDLDVHDVRRTIDMNRIRRVLEGMAPTLTEFTAQMKQSQTDAENEKQKLEALDLESENASKELEDFKISIIVPVRYKLPSRRLVCGHPSCCQAYVSEDDSKEEYKTYQKICHENCDLTAPDMVPGAAELEGCYAFRRGFSRGYPCYICKHKYTDHLHVSSVYVRETKLVENEKKKKVVGKLKSLEEKKQEALRLLGIAEDSLSVMRQEETQINAAQAQIAVYLKHNVVTNYNDAAVTYIDYSISLAELKGKSGDVIQLQQQKIQHQNLVSKMNSDIDSGAAMLLTEEGIDKLIKDLKNMKIYGKYLAKDLEQHSKAEDSNDDEEFRQVAIPSWAEDMRKRWTTFRFRWSF